MVVFVAAGFSLRRTGETPVPLKKVGRKIFDWSQLGVTPALSLMGERERIKEYLQGEH
jgi:hypothetical protein